VKVVRTSEGMNRDVPILGLTGNVITRDIKRFEESGITEVRHKADPTKQKQVDIVLEFARKHIGMSSSGEAEE